MIFWVGGLILGLTKLFYPELPRPEYPEKGDPPCKAQKVHLRRAFFTGFQLEVKSQTGHTLDPDCITAGAAQDALTTFREHDPGRGRPPHTVKINRGLQRVPLGREVARRLLNDYEGWKRVSYYELVLFQPSQAEGVMTLGWSTQPTLS
ncbi:unnamed protein product [Cylicocyclus nassatus]|uniref:Uncharacterized protein n=1 Tax=Cylicocyclus nassatus TaxID=53992 RepID=A0AA36GK78_CYLNA|nr:unnamed protein product [Cylicocyclus nassatus]